MHWICSSVSGESPFTRNKDSSSLVGAAHQTHALFSLSLLLTCLFRWLLICFKREFSFQDVLKLWECVWSSEPEPVDLSIPPSLSNSSVSSTTSSASTSSSFTGVTSQFQLFIALSILETHRDQVTRYLENFDEILQYYNGLAHNMNLEEVIERAEISVKALRSLIQKQEEGDSKLETKFEVPEELIKLVLWK